MTWKLCVLAILIWAAGMYFSVTLGGLIHLLPAGACIVLLITRLSKNPDTEFGRWKSPSDRQRRR